MIHPLIAGLRDYALTLPETEEVFVAQWDESTVRVANKLFLTFRDGSPYFTLKVEKAHQQALIHVPGYRVADHVGRYGWVTVDADQVQPDEAAELVRESYSLVAPKRLAQLIV